MSCFCGRSYRGFVYRHPGPVFREPPVPCCSMDCLNVAATRRGKMQLNVDEKDAVRSVSGEVGEYLEQIGKTDLATMTENEWLGFIAHAYSCVCSQVHKVWARDVPF